LEGKEVGIMKKRNWSVEEKLAIVLEGLKERRSVVEICREHGISQTLYYRWRDKFLEGGKKGLANGHRDDQAHRAEIEKLQKIIGKQAIQIEILKKTAELLGTK
jgi:transposase-like protein